MSQYAKKKIVSGRIRKIENLYYFELRADLMDRCIFGKTTLYRHLCKKCGNPILTSSSLYICDICNFSNDDRKIKRTKIIVPQKRRSCPEETKRTLLSEQENKCYWCGRDFSMIIYYKNKVRKLGYSFDHKVPYDYEQTNRDDNWVASCKVCNSFKSNLLFKLECDASEYLRLRWIEYLHKEKIIILEEE